MVHCYSFDAFSERTDRVLKVLRLPVFHMGVYAIPANEYRKAFSFLALIFQLFDNPARTTAPVSFRMLLNRRAEVVKFLFES